MKVILLNGSPHEAGCTYTALCEVARTLEENGVGTEIVQLGKGPIRGCTACMACRKTGRCVFEDGINELGEKVMKADGLVIGSPVYYAGIAGGLKAALDRLFYPRSRSFAGKPGAAVVSARRSGNVTAFDDINRFFGISSMPIVTSQYWNQVHGSTPEEVRQDLEGMQTMRTLGLNMAWLLRCIALGAERGVALPRYEERVRTNFIR
jgi:multimeric flavodoxin WrbA